MSKGLSMTDCRSVYLESGQNDFTEPPKEACRLDFTDIPFVEAANDKSRQKRDCRGAVDPTSTPDDQPPRF